MHQTTKLPNEWKRVWLVQIRYVCMYTMVLWERSCLFRFKLINLDMFFFISSSFYKCQSHINWKDWKVMAHLSGKAHHHNSLRGLSNIQQECVPDIRVHQYTMLEPQHRKKHTPNTSQQCQRGWMCTANPIQLIDFVVIHFDCDFGLSVPSKKKSRSQTRWLFSKSFRDRIDNKWQ